MTQLVGELIKVYRYENQEGIGPYDTKSMISDFIAEAHNDGKHPCWSLDFDTRFSGDYYSGCDSIYSLRKWFWGFNTELKKEGFRVNTYFIPKEDVEYGKSMKQLRFKR